tara:strand:+ start:60 stop:230 length:171 start_codon:yes stop_codon:yes gene_type:complete
MTKKFIFIFLVAAISYYAGYQGMMPNDIKNFLEEKNITKKFKQTINNTVEFVKENN